MKWIHGHDCKADLYFPYQKTIFNDTNKPKEYYQKYPLEKIPCGHFE